jgi:hypothetical protein
LKGVLNSLLCNLGIAVTSPMDSTRGRRPESGNAVHINAS